MFYSTTCISDLAQMLFDLMPKTPVIIKGYMKLNNVVSNEEPNATFVLDDDGTWTVYDSDPACPTAVDNIDEFFDECSIFGVEVKTRMDGEEANIILVYKDMWG